MNDVKYINKFLRENMMGLPEMVRKCYDFTPSLIDIPTITKYPKYEVVREKADDTHYIVKLLIAGLHKEDIKVSTVKNKLLVSHYPKKDSSDGEPLEENAEYEVLTSSISKRGFTQQFTAPESYIVKVNSAKAENGILYLDIKLEIPEDMKESIINIE